MGRLQSPYMTVLTAITVILFSFACAKSWQATPKPSLINNFEQCNEFSLEEVQMIFIPGYEQAAILVEDCQKYRRERVSIALQTFESAWVSKFGPSENVESMLRTILIGFGKEPRVVHAAYDMQGNRVENGTLIGETLGPNMIWVHAGDNVRLCDTSLVHELIHASIWVIGFDRGDPDHLGDVYQGWTLEHNILMQDVNRRLCVLGI